MTASRRLGGLLAPALVAGALLVPLALPTAPAAAHGPDPVFAGGPFPQDQVLRFRWASGAVPPAAAQAPLLDAAAASNATRGSRAPTFQYDAAATNAVAYGGTVPCGVNGIACMRRDVGAGWFGVWFRPHGHKFDWGTLRWCQLLTKIADGCFDLRNIMLDELGHVLVLDHHENWPDQSDYLDAVVQTVSRARPKVGWDARAYGRCDVAALQLAYGVPTPASPISTCLDVATSLHLAADQGTVPYGGTARFTAYLRMNDRNGRLSQQPLHARTVVLQRRAGGTTWSDMATMSAVLPYGTYTAAVTVYSSGDWRAVFRPSASEGLRAATSAIVTVTVTGSCTGSPCPLRAPGPQAR